LNYAKIAALKLPIGSGAIESLVRQVVNLRMKGNGKFGYVIMRKLCCMLAVNGLPVTGRLSLILSDCSHKSGLEESFSLYSP
jgi:hypothetical protein